MASPPLASKPLASHLTLRESRFRLGIVPRLLHHAPEGVLQLSRCPHIRLLNLDVQPRSCGVQVRCKVKGRRRWNQLPAGILPRLFGGPARKTLDPACRRQRGCEARGRRRGLPVLLSLDDHLLDLRLLLPTGSLKSNFEVVPSFQACPARLALEPWKVSARLALCVVPHAFAEDTPMARDEVFFVLRETFASVVSTVEVFTEVELHRLAYTLHFLFMSFILGH